MWKYSNYIHFTTINGQEFLYNYLNGSLICLSRLEKKYRDILQNKIDISLWMDKYPELFEIVKEELFIYNALINNEQDLIKFRNKKDIFLERNFRLTIIPTLECNYNCWYCYEDHVKGKMSLDTQLRIIKFVISGIQKGQISSLELDWFGGEPLMYFNEIVYPLASKLKSTAESGNIPFRNQITTNGFFLKEINPQYLIDIELYRYQITLDGDKNLHDKIKKHNREEKTFDKTVNNIISLCQYNPKFFVNIRINYTKATLAKMKNVANYFPHNIRKQLKFTFQEVWQESDKHGNDVYNQINEISKYFIHQGYNSSVVSFQVGTGFCCYADRWNQAVILPGNYVFKCTARNFAEVSEADGYLNESGIIEWSEEKVHQRFSNATFENPECLKCKYLPLCLGLCSQKMIEREDKNKKPIQCNLKNMEKSVNDFVCNFIENLIPEFE